VGDLFFVPVVLPEFERRALPVGLFLKHHRVARLIGAKQALHGVDGAPVAQGIGGDARALEQQAVGVAVGRQLLEGLLALVGPAEQRVQPGAFGLVFFLLGLDRRLQFRQALGVGCLQAGLVGAGVARFEPFALGGEQAGLVLAGNLPDVVIGAAQVGVGFSQRVVGTDRFFHGCLGLGAVDARRHGRCGREPKQ